MKIGLDLDDVIVEFSKGYLDFYNLKNRTNLEYKNWTRYNFSDSFGKSKAEANEVMEEFYHSPFFDNLKLSEDSRDSIELLARNNRLFIITARPLRYKEKTEKFTGKYFPDILIKIFYSDEMSKEHCIGKAGLCKREGIDIFIDDSLECALSCSKEGTKTFLLNKPWNQGECNGIIRVKNWQEILANIKVEGE